MEIKRRLVTPALAAEWLARNTNNRTIGRFRVEIMAKDMADNNWVETHQPIAFNCDGSLKDGQHRLSAIVKSGCAQWMWVATGLTDEAMDHIDTHRPRSDADCLSMHGVANAKAVTAVAAAMYNGIGSRNSMAAARRTRTEAIEFAIKHHEAIAFAVGHKFQRGMRSACAIAPLARAWYTQDHDRLREWIECMQTGVVTCQADSAAASCYRFLITPNLLYGGSEQRVQIYAKVASALKSFCLRRPLVRLYAVSEEPFPIPD